MSTAETHMDLDRITHPLRLARGSHQPGSGKGCAMNVISYTNGNDRITDFPTCSARPLAIVVQACNDLLAGPSGYLSPENSVLAIELAWQTVGTVGVADTVGRPGRVRVDHTRQRAPLSVDAGRRDRVRHARPRAGRRGHGSRPRGGARQAGDPLVASSRRAGRLGQRRDIGEQSMRSGFPGRVCFGAVTGSYIHDRNTTVTTEIARRSSR